MAGLEADYRKALEQQIHWKKQREIQEKIAEQKWLATDRPTIFDSLGTNYHRPRTSTIPQTAVNSNNLASNPINLNRATMNPYASNYSNSYGSQPYTNSITPYRSSQVGSGYNSPFPATSQPLMPYNGYQPTAYQPSASVRPVAPRPIQPGNPGESPLEAQLREDLARQVEENKRRKHHEEEIRKMEEHKDQLRIEADRQKIRLEFEEEQRRRLLGQSQADARRTVALEAIRVTTPPLRHLPVSYSTPTFNTTTNYQPTADPPPLRSLSPPIPTLRSRANLEEPKYVKYDPIVTHTPTPIVYSDSSHLATYSNTLGSTPIGRTPSPVFGSRLDPFPNNNYTNPSPLINLALSRPTRGHYDWHKSDVPLHHAIAATRTKLNFDDDDILSNKKLTTKRPTIRPPTPTKSPPILRSQRQPQPVDIVKHRKNRNQEGMDSSGDESDPDAVVNKYIKSRRK